MIKIFKWGAILFSLLLLVGIAQAEPAQLTEVVVTATLNKARINISFSKTPSYKVFSLENPARIVIDLQETELKANLKQLALNATPLAMIRSAPQQEQGLRLVLDLKKPLPNQGISTTVDQISHQLIIELGGPLPKVTAATSQPKPALPIAANHTEKKSNLDIQLAQAIITDLKHDQPPIQPTKVVPNKKSTLLGKAALNKPKEVSIKGSRDVIVVIDPGHGGKDSGARGAKGTLEKDVVLAISKKLQDLIQQQPGMRAILTRKGDYFISLRERLRIARKGKADLFIAIHADAFTNPHSAGASVFALSATGASSEAARWLAEKENYSELGGIPLSDKSDLLRSVLIDLSQTGIISLSLQLGTYLLKDLGKIAHLHHGSVEQARFVVLKSLDTPSVLVETGFISNEQEERRLNNPLYQQQLAEALFRGIRQYFWEYPPPGTRLAAQKETRSPRLVKAESGY